MAESAKNNEKIKLVGKLPIVIWYIENILKTKNEERYTSIKDNGQITSFKINLYANQNKISMVNELMKIGLGYNDEEIEKAYETYFTGQEQMLNPDNEKHKEFIALFEKKGLFADLEKHITADDICELIADKYKAMKKKETRKVKITGAAPGNLSAFNINVLLKYFKASKEKRIEIMDAWKFDETPKKYGSPFPLNKQPLNAVIPIYNELYKTAPAN